MPMHPIWRLKHRAREALRWLTWRARVAPRGARSRPIVLMFHTVGDGRFAIYPGNVVPSTDFQRSLDLIESSGREVVPLATLFDDPARSPESAGAVALTFDDGYRGCLDVVAPMLDRRGWPATFFVCPGFIDRGEPKWDDLLYLASERFDKRLLRAPRRQVEAAIEATAASAALRRRCAAELLSWDGLRRLRDLGFSIGSHGLDHYFLAAQTEERQEREIVESKRRLEQELETPVEHLAYPFGFPACFDATTKRLARAAGYGAAFTCGDRYANEGADRFETPRFAISRHTPSWRLELIVSGAYH